MLNKLFIFFRISAGSVFVVSGFIKLMQPYQNFLATIQTYEILNSGAAEVLARSMPWTEFVVGVFLVLGFWSRISILVLWIFNTVFIGVISSALFRRLPIQDCGCFGDSFSLQPQQTLLLDIALWIVFMFLAAYFNRTQYFSLDNLFDDKRR